MASVSFATFLFLIEWCKTKHERNDDELTEWLKKISLKGLIRLFFYQLVRQTIATENSSPIFVESILLLISLWIYLAMGL